MMEGRLWTLVDACGTISCLEMLFSEMETQRRRDAEDDGDTNV